MCNTIYADVVAIVNPSTDQCMVESGDHIREERVTDGAELTSVIKEYARDTIDMIKYNMVFVAISMQPNHHF